MILIADSGSTKTDWCLTEDSGCNLLHFTTQGINPFHQSQREITDLLHKEVLPCLDCHTAHPANHTEPHSTYSATTPSQSPLSGQIEGIYFYGSGCTTEKSPILRSALQETFPQISTVEVASDLLGAARSLCGHQPGIVCILGTGSNSCYYDGTQIVRNIPPLGYILGDEGSGAALGKRLIGDCLKQQLPEKICSRFLAYCPLSPSEIIDKVYRRPMPNRFLAECSRFLYANRQEESIHRLLTECFSDFIRRNVLSYPDGSLFFTGSIACYYAEELKEVTQSFGLSIADIQQRPMEGLIRFHSKKQEV